MAPANRVRTWLSASVVGGLLVATAAAFVITERLKLTPSPIVGTRVSKVFSPVCRCASGRASIRFRLRHGGLVEVDVIDGNGALVRRLARRRSRAGLVSFEWFGRDQSGAVSPNGEYRIRVHLPSDHRTIVFPNLIRLDTVVPKVEELQVARRTIRVGERTRIAYRFSESAHPIVFIDGRKALYGRFAHVSGTVDWFGKIDARPVRAGVHSIAVAARDDAGNQSRLSEGIAIRVRAPVALSKSRHHRPRKS